MNARKPLTNLSDSDSSSSNSKLSDTMVSYPVSDTNKVVIDIHNTDQVIIENIQEEKSLIDYTENRAAKRRSKEQAALTNVHIQLAMNDDEFEKDYIRCDSPITISNYGSRNGSNPGSSHNSDLEDNEEPPRERETLRSPISLSDIATIREDGKCEIKPKRKSEPRSKNTHYKQLAYRDIEKTVDKYYEQSQTDNKFSNEIDILTTYTKGQKNLYIQSKNFSQLRLNALMMPSILITGAITILSPFITCESSNKAIITILNGIAALFISMINYLKLESATEMYLQMATHYDKLETMLEITGSKLIMLDNDADKRALVLGKIQDVEQKIIEAKETNQVLIPEQIKALFPIISHINVISFLKKMETHKQTLIYRLKDVKNEIRFILYKWKKEGAAAPSIERTREQKRLDFLCGIKDNLKIEIRDYRSVYGQLDEIITREINGAEKKINVWGIWYLCFWNSMQSKANIKGVNPIVDKYFHFIFADE